MFRVLRFSAKTTVADVARSIQRTPARRIALVFPLGDRTRFADTGRMDIVARICGERRKDVTIVGGDELLRACAVACGLRAAVTLEDWHDAQPTWSLRRAKPRLSMSRLQVIPKPAGAQSEASVEPDGEADDGADDRLDVDPPAYIQELLALYQQEPESRMAASAREPITLPRPFAVATRTSDLAYDLDYDLDCDDLVRALAEDDEERLTTTIRQTSGLDQDLFAQSWPGALEAAAPDGPTTPR